MYITKDSQITTLLLFYLQEKTMWPDRFLDFFMEIPFSLENTLYIWFSSHYNDYKIKTIKDGNFTFKLCTTETPSEGVSIFTIENHKDNILYLSPEHKNAFTHSDIYKDYLKNRITNFQKELSELENKD